MLHGSIDEAGNILIKKEHADWLYNLYLEEFIDLGLDQNIEKQQFMEAHAEEIISSCGYDAKRILKLLSKYGSQSAVEKAGFDSRKGIYNILKNLVTYQMNYEDVGIKECFYSFHEGSGQAEFKGYGENQYYELVSVDGLLEKLMKQDGTFTLFGRLLLKKAQLEPNLVPLPKLKKKEDKGNVI